MFKARSLVYYCLFSIAPSIAPADVNTERLNGTHMTVTWTVLTLEQARGFITGYTVSYEPASNTGGRRKRDSEETSVSEPPAPIGGLSPNLAYSVTVRANTAAGAGVSSEPITASGVWVLARLQVHIFYSFFSKIQVSQFKCLQCL